MSKISVFQDNSGNARIKRDKLESFLKEVKSNLAIEHISGNESASVQKTMTLAIACQKLFNELEELESKPKRNCDIGTVEEQLERHRLYCIGLCTTHECSYDLEKHDTETCKKCFAKWAQMRSVEK